jgi:leader peptidase (prepilin peptidase) / N-methyltransferase
VSLAWAACGAVAGLPAGTALRDPVWRLSAPKRAGTAFRDPATRPGIALEVATAAVTALLLARFGIGPAVAAFAYLGVTGVALAEVDLAVQRLPDQLTLPAYPALIILLTLAAWAGDAWGQLGRALAGGLVLGAVYLVLGLAGGGRLGGGDIKLAGLLGIALGWLGWRQLMTGAALGFVLAAVASLVLLAARKVSRRDMVSFGPWMLAGAMLAVLATGL